MNRLFLFRKTDNSSLYQWAAYFFIFLIFYQNGISKDNETANSAHWDFVRYTFEVKGDKVYEKSHRRLTVLNPRGDNFAKLFFSETPFEKIKKLRIDFKYADDRTSKSWGLKDLTKFCGFGADYAVYQDICHFVYSAMSPGFPYSVEVFEEKEYLNPFYFRGTSFSTKIPTSSILCSLVYPAKTPLRFKSYALPLSVSETFEKNNKIVVWSGENIEPPDFDTLSALDYELAGSISVVIDDFKFINSAFSGGTWADVGRWYAELLRKRYGWESIKPPGDPNPAAYKICKETYDQVIGEYRYVSVSIGVSGWQPRLINDIAKSKYGDCKDLSMLLVKELREKNIEIYPVLILTRGSGLIDSDFPNFGFNHLIAAAVSGDDTLWMDPTCRSCPFGLIPWADQYSYAVMVTDTAGILVRTPRSTATDNQILRSVDIVLKPDRRLESKIQMDLTGQFGSSFREYFTHATKPEQLEFVESYLGGKLLSYKLKDYSVESVNDIYKPLRLNISAISVNPVRKVGQVVYIDPCIIEPSLNLDNSIFEIVRPIKLKYHDTKIESVRISLDTSIEFDSIVPPPLFEYKSELGSWLISGNKSADGTDGQITMTLTRTLDEIFITPNKFELMKEFNSVLSNRENRMVKVYLK